MRGSNKRRLPVVEPAGEDEHRDEAEQDPEERAAAGDACTAAEYREEDDAESGSVVSSRSAHAVDVLCIGSVVSGNDNLVRLVAMQSPQAMSQHVPFDVEDPELAIVSLGI